MNKMRHNYFKIELFIGLFIVTLLLIELAFGDSGYEIELSHESGFYQGDFELSLNSKKGEIYYTVDSCTPSKDSIRYTSPILISDASNRDNVYSCIDNTTISYNREMIDLGYAEESKYPHPANKIDKCNVIRAVCIDRFGTVRDEITACYFVDFDKKSGYDSLPIVSIVTDPNNLFDYENGILVTGKTLSDYISNLNESEEFSDDDYQANFNQRGKAWEREASVSVFSSDKTNIWNGNCGIRTQGARSRNKTNRGYNIFNREKEKIKTTALGFDFDLNSFSLTSGGSNDGKMKLRDVVANFLTSGENFVTRRYLPCELFLDGEYWGLYYITEIINEEFYENHYLVDEKHLEAIKNGVIDIGRESTEEEYNDLKTYISENDMSDENCYNIVCQYVDMDSMIDYYATEIYLANYDWPRYNSGLWRTDGSLHNGPYADGKWRYVFFDLNYAMDAANSYEDWLKRTELIDSPFISLMDNTTFSEAVRNKLYLLALNEFNPNVVIPYINACEAAMAPAMQKDYERNYAGCDFEVFHEECESFRNFFINRYDYITTKYSPEEKGL